MSEAPHTGTIAALQLLQRSGILGPPSERIVHKQVHENVHARPCITHESTHVHTHAQTRARTCAYEQILEAYIAAATSSISCALLTPGSVVGAFRLSVAYSCVWGDAGGAMGAFRGRVEGGRAEGEGGKRKVGPPIPGRVGRGQFLHSPLNMLSAWPWLHGARGEATPTAPQVRAHHPAGCDMFVPSGV